MPPVYLRHFPTNSTVPVTNMFDIMGEETDDPEDAITYVAGPLPDGQWFATGPDDRGEVWDLAVLQ